MSKVRSRPRNARSIISALSSWLSLSAAELQTRRIELIEAGRA